MTVRVEESVRIARSPADVWDAIADYGFDRQWRNGLQEMSPEPPGGPTAGTKVHVEGFQAKDRSFRASGREITLPDGKSLFMGQGGNAAPSAE